MAGIEAIMGAAAVPALLRESLEGLKTVKKYGMPGEIAHTTL